MNKEFKKSTKGLETHYVLETMTAGATGASAIATAEKDLGEVQRRNPEPPKPRNFVAKNAKMGGAGAHKDKKKDQKQGKEKHKKPFAEDHEISMASNELKSITADAMKLLMLIKRYSEMDGLEAWQQSKITKAADYLNSVLQSVGGEQGVAEGLRDPKDNPCWKGYKPVGTKQKGGRTVPNCVPKEGIEEGAEFGSNYAEQLAQQIFNKRQDISSEDEVLNQAYHIVSNDQGQKAARYMFNYDEDFPSDLVSAYFWLQKNSDSVTEEQGYDEVSPKSASYILRKLDQGVPMSSILDDFPELSRMMDVIAHEHGLHPDDDFEQIEDVLMNDLEDIAAQEDDFGDYDRDEEPDDQYMESLVNSLVAALNEKAPEGWEGTVKAMKKHKDIDNPWALAHWMKGKGYKSHKKSKK